MDLSFNWLYKYLPKVAIAKFTLSKIAVQTNFPSNGKTHIFRTGMKSTFTWAMPYKSISVLLIT